MRRYHGWRSGGHRLVWVTEGGELRWLNMRRDVWDHSGTFDWGPAAEIEPLNQLALALLADAVGRDVAVRVYHDLAVEELPGLPDRWVLTSAWLKSWAADVRP